MVGVVTSGSHVAVDENISSSHTIRRPSIPSLIANRRPSAVRHSMDEYYQQEGISEPPEPPPNYDALLECPKLRRRFNIQPREDEGREVLPPYSCEISVQSVFARKMELEGAVHKAVDRNWYKVLVTLQGTALSFHKYQKAGIFSSGRDDESGRQIGSDNPAGLKRGEFLRSYNLQHADVGIAADYLKKKYVIRVRAEADQFLLSCNKIETFVLWLQSLFAAIDLAPPLDDREIPRDLSIPRRTRRRVTRPVLASTATNAALIREQEEIISTQFPGLAATENDAVPTAGVGEEDGDDIEAEEIESASSSPAISRPVSRHSSPSPSPSRRRTHPILSLPRSTSHPSTSSTTTQPRTLLTRARTTFLPSTSSGSNRPIPRNPNITSDGKWRPQHQWTHFYDMMYAKRCMAILTHRSPRKSNLVIWKGRRWVVDWGTGGMEACEPPGYLECV